MKFEGSGSKGNQVIERKRSVTDGQTDRWTDGQGKNNMSPPEGGRHNDGMTHLNKQQREHVKLNKTNLITATFTNLPSIINPRLSHIKFQFPNICLNDKTVS